MNSPPSLHEDFMNQIFDLLEAQTFRTAPNPQVAALLVKNNRVYAQGLHRGKGSLHAETDALRNLKGSAKGLSLYCNLEPCCHQGPGKLQPPCAPQIIEAGISSVHIANLDPNPQVRGRSLAYLRQKGLEVTYGHRAARGIELNLGFFTRMLSGLPAISLKFAQTLDGYLADESRESRWISNEKARNYAHKLRAKHDGLLVGLGTLIKDDPSLDVRHCPGENPEILIVDSRLKSPLSSKIFNASRKVTLFCQEDASKEAQKRLEEKAIQVVRIPDKRQKNPLSAEDTFTKPELDLEAVFRYLGERGMNSVLVEGGSQVLSYCLRQGFYDRIYAFIAPKILGSGLKTFTNLGIQGLAGSKKIERVQYEFFDDQLLLKGYKDAETLNLDFGGGLCLPA